MKTHISLSLGYLFMGSLLLFVVTAITSILIFWLGWQKGAEFSLTRTVPDPATSQDSVNADQPGKVLPKAMTATPKPKVETAMVITSEDLRMVLNQQIESAGTEVELQVQSVEITPDGLTLRGSIDGLGFRGPVEITGTPAAAGGKLTFYLDRISIEGMEIPKVVYPTIEKEINRYFEEWMWGYEVQMLELEDNTLTVTVIDW